MSLRILFADDSVTAQNMGKKILTEAGYDVVAVSNGAAAVKKIAEQKPDIIILDLYMPGYSGLEVCEKVRASIATIRTPVLLTVGKMEPYKPEDANRVRADGVIIKPFEASDLLAIVKKFEERIGQMPAPPPQAAARPAEEISVAPPVPQVEHPEPPQTTSFQPLVEVPDHMATSSAFSDLLGADTSHAMDQFNVSTPRRVPESQPAQGPATAAIMPEYELPVAWRGEAEPVPVVAAAPPVAILPEPAAVVAEEVQEVVPPRPRLIPVFQEPEAPRHEFVPTAAAASPDIDIPREPELEESAEETTRNTVADAREPGLMPTLHQAAGQLDEISRPVEFAPAPQMPPLAMAVNTAPEIQLTAPEPVAEEPSFETHSSAPAPPVSENDFEARVAAAMAAYNQPPQAARAPAAVIATEPPQIEEMPAVEAVVPMQSAPADIEPPPSQYQPPVNASENHHQAVPASVEVKQPAPEPIPSIAVEPEATPAAEAGVEHEEVAARVEADLPAAAAAAAAVGMEAGGDHQTIAQAVHRVMERVKGDLVEEILRELKSKK